MNFSTKNRKYVPLSLTTCTETIFLKTKTNKIASNYMDTGGKIKSNLPQQKLNAFTKRAPRKNQTLSSIINQNISNNNNNHLFRYSFNAIDLKLNSNKSILNSFEPEMGANSFIKSIENNNNKYDNNTLEEINDYKSITKRNNSNTSKGSSLNTKTILITPQYYEKNNNRFNKHSLLLKESNSINLNTIEYKVNNKKLDCLKFNKNEIKRHNVERQLKKNKKRAYILELKKCFDKDKEKIKKDSKINDINSLKINLKNIFNNENENGKINVKAIYMSKSRNANCIKSNNKNLKITKISKVNLDKNNLIYKNYKAKNQQEEILLNHKCINKNIRKISKGIKIITRDENINIIKKEKKYKQKNNKSIDVKIKENKKKPKEIGHKRKLTKLFILNNFQIKNIIKNCDKSEDKYNEEYKIINYINNTQDKNKKIPYIKPTINKNTKNLNILSLIKENSKTLKDKSFQKFTPKGEDFNDIDRILYDKEEENEIIKENYFDNFDDLNNIVKKINFDEVNIEQNNIFTSDKNKNIIYSEFEKEFNQRFINSINRDLRNKKRNYSYGKSASTKDNSSKKKNFSIMFINN